VRHRQERILALQSGDPPQKSGTQPKGYKPSPIALRLREARLRKKQAHQNPADPPSFKAAAGSSQAASHDHDQGNIHPVNDVYGQSFEALSGGSTHLADHPYAPSFNALSGGSTHLVDHPYGPSFNALSGHPADHPYAPSFNTLSGGSTHPVLDPYHPEGYYNGQASLHHGQILDPYHPEGYYNGQDPGSSQGYRHSADHPYAPSFNTASGGS